MNWITQPMANKPKPACQTASPKACARGGTSWAAAISTPLTTDVATPSNTSPRLRYHRLVRAHMAQAKVTV